MTGRYGQWQQRGVVRRLLRPGCRAVRRVRTPRAGWNGLRGRGVCGARSRREVPLLLAAGCCLVVPPAGIALRARLRARRSAAQHRTAKRMEARMRSEGTAAFLQPFVASNPQKRPTTRNVRQHARCNNRSEKTHVTFCFANSSGFEASLNATKWPRVQPKPASPALQGFFCFLCLAPYAGVLNTT